MNASMHDVVIIEWTGFDAQVSYVVPKGKESEFMRRYNTHGHWRIVPISAIYLPSGD